MRIFRNARSFHYENGLNGLNFYDVLNNKNTEHTDNMLMQLRPPQIKIQNWYPLRAVKTFKRKRVGQTVQFPTLNKFFSKANQKEANDYFEYRYEIRPLSFAAGRIVMKFVLLFYVYLQLF